MKLMNNRNWGLWAAGLMLLFIVTAPLACLESRKWASAEVTVIDNEVTVIDNNGYLVPCTVIEFRSLNKIGFVRKHSIHHGSTIVGNFYKGEYEMRVWFGELDRIDHLLYSGKVKLEKEKQPVYIPLDNVTQRILILAAEPNTKIPVSLAGESIKIKPYQK